MPDFNAQFWCEFAASLLVAVGAWLVGARFLLKQDDAEFCQAPEWIPARLKWLGEYVRPLMAEALAAGGGDLPQKSDEEIHQLDLSVLQNAVRFAEEGIKSQLHSTGILERKAILLGTLCAVMLGLLLSDKFNFSDGGIPGFAAFFLFLTAVVFCARAVDFSQPRGHVGFSPFTMMEFFNNPRPMDEKVVLYNALIKYEQRAKVNQKMNDRKHRSVHCARILWVAGTSAFLGMMTGEFGAATCACDWLLK